MHGCEVSVALRTQLWRVSGVLDRHQPNCLSQTYRQRPSLVFSLLSIDFQMDPLRTQYIIIITLAQPCISYMPLKISIYAARVLVLHICYAISELVHKAAHTVCVPPEGSSASGLQTGCHDLRYVSRLARLISHL